MRRLAYILAAAALIVVAAAAYLSTKISAPAVLRATAEKVGVLTGYGIEIRGGATVTFLPLPSFEARDVVLVLPRGGEATEIAAIDILQGDVAVLPLVLGRIAVGDFVLTRPRLSLTVDRRGRPNWMQLRPGAVGAGSASGAAVADREEAADDEADRVAAAGLPEAAPLPDVAIGDVRIRDGAVVYVDQRTGVRQEVSAINATVSWSRLAAPLEAAGALIWNGEPVRFGLAVQAPPAFLGHGSTPARILVESGIVNVAFDGNAHNTADLQLEGTVTLSAPSVRGLLRWIGADPGTGPGLNALSLSGRLNLIGRSVSLSDLVLDLDGNDAEGVFKIVLGERRTDLQGTLAFEALDLGVYRTPPADGAPPPAATKATPVDLSALEAIAADIRVSAASVTLGDLRLGRSAGTVTVRNGALDLGVGEATLYGGTAQGTISAAPVEGGAQVKALLKLDNTDIGPLLAALTGDAPVSGPTAARMNLTGSGRTLGEVVASLSGDARLSIGPGSIEGIDVERLLGALEAGKVEGWPAAPARTVIDRLTATFTVAGGNAATADFRLNGPNIAVEADGEIRLVSASLAGHGTAELGPAPAPGGDAADGEEAIYAVPFVIEGPIANPILYPDPLWLLDRAEASPEEIDRIRQELQQSSPQDVIDDIVRRGLDRLPRLPPASAEPTTPQQ